MSKTIWSVMASLSEVDTIDKNREKINQRIMDAIESLDGVNWPSICQSIQEAFNEYYDPYIVRKRNPQRLKKDTCGAVKALYRAIIPIDVLPIEYFLLFIPDKLGWRNGKDYCKVYSRCSDQNQERFDLVWSNLESLVDWSKYSNEELQNVYNTLWVGSHVSAVHELPNHTLRNSIIFKRHIPTTFRALCSRWMNDRENGELSIDKFPIGYKDTSNRAPVYTITTDEYEVVSRCYNPLDVVELAVQDKLSREQSRFIAYEKEAAFLIAVVDRIIEHYGCVEDIDAKISDSCWYLLKYIVPVFGLLTQFFSLGTIPKYSRDMVEKFDLASSTHNQDITRAIDELLASINVSRVVGQQREARYGKQSKMSMLYPFLDPLVRLIYESPNTGASLAKSMLKHRGGDLSIWTLFSYWWCTDSADEWNDKIQYLHAFAKRRSFGTVSIKQVKDDTKGVIHGRIVFVNNDEESDWKFIQARYACDKVLTLRAQYLDWETEPNELYEVDRDFVLRKAPAACGLGDSEQYRRFEPEHRYLYIMYGYYFTMRDVFLKTYKGAPEDFESNLIEYSKKLANMSWDDVKFELENNPSCVFY